MTFAADTTVPVERSRAEIEATLTRYGATAFHYGWNEVKAIIEFTMSDRHIRFTLPLPDKNSKDFKYRLDQRSNPPRKVPVDSAKSYKLWEQACRSRWRALLLAVKAKLEAVEVGISCFDQEFFAHIVDPGTGKTVYEIIAPQLAISYEQERGAPRSSLLLTAAPVSDEEL
jgi:hypothetical protein